MMLSLSIWAAVKFIWALFLFLLGLYFALFVLWVIIFCISMAFEFIGTWGDELS